MRDVGHFLQKSVVIKGSKTKESDIIINLIGQPETHSNLLCDV